MAVVTVPSPDGRDLPGDLAGKTVVVTGAARGIGAAFARAFCGAGANVVIADVAVPEGERLAGELDAASARALFVATDVTDQGSLAALIGRVEGRFGTVDVLVNNAALYMDLTRRSAFDEIDPEMWDRVMAVNVRGCWQAATVAAASMRRGEKGGRIINIASLTAFSGTPGFAHYVASKAAVVGLTRALARELGPEGITVNAIAPGLVDNEASRSLNDESYMAGVVGMRALQRPMTADDLIGSVLFLAGPGSAFMTGQVLVVDGGTLMR
jgi:NAD(P)-dependent dehydrogenase (short-subunit alcohol dehydrogenase family)